MSESKKKATAKKESTKKVEKVEVAAKAVKTTKKAEVKPAKKAEVKATKKEEVKPTKKVENKAVDKAVLKAAKKANKKEASPEFVIITICVVIIVALIALLSWYFSKEAYKPVATFEGGQINKTEFLPYYKMFDMQYGAYYGEENKNELKKGAAEQAAAAKKLVILAKENNVKLTSEAKAEIEAQLASEDIKNIIEATSLTREDIKKIFEDSKYAELYMDVLESKIPETELKAYVDKKYKNADLSKYVTRHILFKTQKEDGTSLDASAKATVKVKAEAVLKRALAGEDFPGLAKEFSEDEGSGENGGLIEFVDGDPLVEEYIAAAKKLSKGQVSAKLVESSFGYHIIKLDEKIKDGKLHAIKEEMVGEDYSEIIKNSKITLNESALATIVVQ